MPVLHQYKDRQEFYVLTAIGGSIVTFQLTREGQHRLKASGIETGNKFGRALLLDLYRSGDAFTHHTGTESSIDDIDAGQLAFDFTDDPEPESLFPACSDCPSVDDLHLVELKHDIPSASILCSHCRVNKAASIDTSIPLPMVSRGIISTLLMMKGIHKISESVRHYQELLDSEFTSRWNALAVKKKEKQESLFGIENEEQGSLL